MNIQTLQKPSPTKAVADFLVQVRHQRPLRPDLIRRLNALPRLEEFLPIANSSTPSLPLPPLPTKRVMMPAMHTYWRNTAHEYHARHQCDHRLRLAAISWYTIAMIVDVY